MTRRSHQRSAAARAKWTTWSVPAVVMLAMLVLMVSASAGQAAFGVARFDGQVVDRDSVGTPVAASQAGMHPGEASTTIDLNQIEDTSIGIPIPLPDGGSIRDLRVDLPAGLVGNPLAAARCTEAELSADANGMACPPDSQVGVAAVVQPGTPVPAVVPLLNMVPPPGAPAAFAFSLASVKVHLRARVRSESDYGLSIDVLNINQGLPILATSVTFWGVPADPSHDADRIGGATRAPRKAFLTNPTSCTPAGVGLETSLYARSWAGEQDRASFVSHDVAPNETQPLGPTGCERVPFDPSFAAKPLDRKRGQPSGFSFEIAVPQDDNPDGLAQSHLRRAVVTLPEGVAITPPSAAGLGACSDGDTAIGRPDEPTCPDNAKIGRVTIDTPLLEEPMVGSIYLRQPQPGSLFRLLLTARAAGVHLKLPGVVVPDPRTGQLTTTFENNPQLPFSSLKLDFKGGPRAPLVLPVSCGVHRATAEFTSWSGKTVRVASDFTVDAAQGGRCGPRGFSPDFVAGLSNPVAGTSSDFVVSFARSDEDQTLRDVTVALPPGLVGRIAEADLCSDPAAATGTCGERSLIGSTITGAGAGTNPFHLPGRVYITGPYKGAPFGLSIVVPAIAGPFDLGTVVVRAAIHVDERNASLRIVSDPLPTILEGVPLSIRSVRVVVDKPGFMLAPTRCQPSTIGSRITSNEGAAATPSSRFQVGACATLPYRPSMRLKVGKRGRTRAGLTTPLEVTLRMGRGDANNRVVDVTLPLSLNSRLAVVSNRNACLPAQFEADRCPQTVGTATAVTPLLRDPLRGRIHMLRNPARRLPDMAIALKGQVDIELIGKIQITRDLRVRTIFDAVPDVPIDKFTLRLVSGRNGAVGVVTNLCSARGRRQSIAALRFTGQNGSRVTRNQRLQVVGCGRATARSRRGASRRSDSRSTRRGSRNRR